MGHNLVWVLWGCTTADLHGTGTSWCMTTRFKYQAIKLSHQGSELVPIRNGETLDKSLSSWVPGTCCPPVESGWINYQLNKLTLSHGRCSRMIQLHSDFFKTENFNRIIRYFPAYYGNVGSSCCDSDPHPNYVSRRSCGQIKAIWWWSNQSVSRQKRRLLDWAN